MFLGRFSHQVLKKVTHKYNNTNHQHQHKHIASNLISWSHRLKSTNSSKNDNSKDFFHSAHDIFASLRRKAATALTASLSNTEREELLSALQPPPPSKVHQGEENVDVLTGKSVQEAIAQAKAEEARKLQSKFAEEIQTITKDLEDAARKRVENELAVQKRRIEYAKWEQELAEQKDDGRVQTPDVEEHPVLGKPVLDMGYKKIYVVSAESLGTIPVWKKQRIYRHDRVKAMADDKMKTLHLGFPGIIGLHEDPSGNLSILDGQHRVGMMSILRDKRPDALHLDRVLVEVYPQRNPDETEHARDIFLEINKAEPVKLVDMPGVAKSGDRKIITDGATRLMERFPEMFKPSQNCRSPHLNIDNFRDALFGADLLQRHKLKSGKALEEWLLEVNERERERYQEDADLRNSKAKTAMAKADQYGFYLGMDSSWLYR